MSRAQVSDKLKRQLKKIYNNSCADCGAPGGLEAHHIKPVIDGGKNRLKNLVLVCMVCHVIRHGKTPRKLLSTPFWIKVRYNQLTQRY